MITLENVTKAYKGTTVALRDVSVDIAEGRVRLPRRPVRVGQVDLPPPAHQGGAARRRARSGWPARTSASSAQWKVPYLRRNIGCVFQDFKLLPNKTVYENVAFALEVIGRPAPRDPHPGARRSSTWSAWPRRADNLPHELSGGEQQRVSIARAFVNRPLILLADEPTGNLDPTTSVGIMRLLDRINRTGTTVVMATHDRGHRRHDAPPGHRARPRHRRPRPGPRRLRDGGDLS